jgi:phosphoglucosamine mutase
MNLPLFGTDGIRGSANSFPVDPFSVLKVAMLLGHNFKNGDHKHRIIIGKDTRLSGYMLENAMTAGFIAMGFDVILVGPLPSPAISMLIRSFRADLGVMISASHNPYEDNGIKIFGPDSRKLSDEKQNIITHQFYNETISPVPSALMGKARRDKNAPGRYIEYLKNTLPPDISFDGMKIVVDCAHGAGYRIAPQVLFELGAQVIPIGVNPDGTNINLNCGATNTLMLSERVISENADIGLALDGDADRLQVVDHLGNPIEGEQILALIAQHWKLHGKLRQNTIVSTIDANISLAHFLKSQGIDLKSTNVGDRHVHRTMMENGFNLGGEPSGHIIMSDFSESGDGILASLHLLSILCQKNVRIGDVHPLFKAVPKKQFNLPIINSDPMEDSHVQKIVADLSLSIQEKHGGKLLVRRSGTEPVIRVTVEVKDPKIADSVAGEVTNAIRAAS